MTQYELPADSVRTLPPRARHSSGGMGGPPLYVWPIIAMAAMLPVLALLIVALVT